MAPIVELPALRYLSMQVCHRLTDFAGLAKLRNLRCLNFVEATKLDNLEALSGLHDLEVLTLVAVGNIASVAPLSELKQLKALWIAGSRTKIIDGDLTPLTTLPKLAMLTLGNKRHYSHKVIQKWSWSNIDKPAPQLVPR